jgi:hypothetical protein
MTLFCPSADNMLLNYEICNDAKISSSCFSAGSAVAAAAIGPFFHTRGEWVVRCFLRVCTLFVFLYYGLMLARLLSGRIVSLFATLFGVGLEWTLGGLGMEWGMNRFYSSYEILECVLCRWDPTLFPLWALLEDADVWVSPYGVVCVEGLLDRDGMVESE